MFVPLFSKKTNYLTLELFKFGSSACLLKYEFAAYNVPA
jgi:hypothetical protein